MGKNISAFFQNDNLLPNNNAFCGWVMIMKKKNCYK